MSPALLTAHFVETLEQMWYVSPRTAHFFNGRGTIFYVVEALSLFYLVVLSTLVLVIAF